MIEVIELTDLFLIATFTGVIGGVIVDALTYLYVLIGIPTSTPWQIAADVFLDPPYLHTPSGIALGIIMTLALGIGTAFVVVLALKTTGREYAVLKGVLISNALSFINLGFTLPLLNIWPQIHREPITFYVAMVNLTILGVVLGYLIKKWWKP